MALLIAKYLLSALVIVVASELAKRTDKIGALIGALPFVAFMVMIWLHIGRQEPAKISNYALLTFWYVLPTLPMFLLMSWMIDKQINFWLTLLACVAFSGVCFLITVPIAKWFGVDMIP